MLGLIAYLSTTAFFSQALAVLLLPVAVFRIATDPKLNSVPAYIGARVGAGLGLIVLAILSAVFVFIAIPPKITNYDRSIIGAFPYVLLIGVSMVIGYAFKLQDFKVILILVLLEILAGLIEYSLGVRSIFGVENRSQYEVGDTELFYYNRVYGASLNSSIYALKVFYGLLIAVLLRREIFKSDLIYIIFLFLLTLGFITSFNRTAILAAVAFLLVRGFKNIRIAAFLLVFGGALALFMSPLLLDNFSRGGDSLNVSGRSYIFREFWAFFIENPLLGNSGSKVWLDINELSYHAHNSYLEFLASNGLLISILFFSGFFLLFLTKSCLAAFPFLLYSMAQYGLFWGLSFNDVVFFGLMFFLLRKKY